MDRRQFRVLTGTVSVVLVLGAVAMLVRAEDPPRTPAPAALAPDATPAALSSPTPMASPAVTAPPPATTANSPRAALPPGGNNPRPWVGRPRFNQDQRDPAVAGPRALPPGQRGRNPAGPADGEDPLAVRQMVERMPPQERAVFRRNFRRWAQMSVEERQALRGQAAERRLRMQQEMDAALRESGLQLDEDHREVFWLRYAQERRKLERELQEKAAAERARRAPDIIRRLQQEFAGVSAVPPPPLPSPSATTPQGIPTSYTTPSSPGR